MSRATWRARQAGDGALADEPPEGGQPVGQLDGVPRELPRREVRDLEDGAELFEGEQRDSRSAVAGQRGLQDVAGRHVDDDRARVDRGGASA